MERIGVLGGTFNPIHNGHIHLAESFAEILSLDRVLLMPVNSPPHKHAEMMQEGRHRLAMCRIAARGRPLLEVSDVELTRGGTSYTVDTLLALSRQYPGARLYFIMGADMFLTLEEWRNFPEIARLAVLCSSPRLPGQAEKLRRYARQLASRYDAQCDIENIPVLEVSSTQIREALTSGADTGALLPPGVAEYIRENGLYRPEAAERCGMREEKL